MTFKPRPWDRCAKCQHVLAAGGGGKTCCEGDCACRCVPHRVDQRRRIYALFRWRMEALLEPVSPGGLAISLSCEGIDYEEVPKRHYKALVALRHLRYDLREAFAKRFLNER